MISLLAKWLIPNREQVEDGAVRRAWGALCGFVGIGLNILLFAGKLVAGTLSGSIAITADAFNNLSDAGSSVVTLLGFRLAGKKPDAGHPFGHGRLEYVSGLIVAGLILLMGAELAKSSVDKIFHPEAVTFSWLAAGILLASIGVKLYMYLYNRAVGKKIKSAAMSATAADSLSDTAATSAVLLAMVIGKLTNVQLDGWVGLVVALFILWSAVQAARDTISPLLGQAPDPMLVKEIESLVMAHDTVVGIHDLVVHDYGPGRCIISLHAEVPADGQVLELHDVIDNIEEELAQKLHCEAVIHMDPVVVGDPTVTALHQQVAALVKTIDPRITIHDFRMVPGQTHTNLIFDAVIPFDERLTRQQVADRIRQMVSEMEGDYRAVVKVENSYVSK
ncbi:MAG: cation diffusion facilitator family transporter [Vescimonas sp.]